MVNSVSTNTGYANQAMRQELLKNANNDKTNAVTISGTAESSAAVTADTITLSSEAKANTSQSSTSSSYYKQCMPTRDGFSSDNLIADFTDPGAEPFSGGKTIAQVASAAGNELDIEYAAMEASGEPFDFNSSEGRDWNSLMGNLDRRALYAISSNQDGLFTKEEQDMAVTIMGQQQGLATGSYAGPNRLPGNSFFKYANDTMGFMKATMNYLDKVSNDEKSSVSWAFSRASAEMAYRWLTEDQGTTTENVDSENPLVKLLMSAMATMKEEGRGTTNGIIKNADDLKNQSWFKGFENQFAATIDATQKMYEV
jgi:hypothetical protein